MTELVMVYLIGTYFTLILSAFLIAEESDMLLSIVFCILIALAWPIVVPAYITVAVTVKTRERLK